MPRRHFKMCRSPLQADDTHAECVSCLGKSQADAALSRTDCAHCEIFSLASLHSRIAFFSESNCAPRTPPFFLPGTCEEKTVGRGFEQPVTSELTPAQCPRASPSPQREHSPFLFAQHDSRFKVFLFVTYSIIQNIISSEMEIRSVTFCGCERHDLVLCE